MEKPQLINFIAKVMEDSGFKVYKYFKTSQKVIDIYAVLPTNIGDFGVVVACKNNDKKKETGIDVLKEMEDVAENVNASKITVVSSSYFSKQATNYALRKNIKLVDRNNLLELARKYQDKTSQTTLDNTPYDGGASKYLEEQYPGYNYASSDMEYLMNRRDQNPFVYKNTLYRQTNDNNNRSLFSSFFANENPAYQNPPGPTTLYNYNVQNSFTQSPIFNLIKNPLVMIILVVIISYAVARISGSLLGVDAGHVGLIEMILALILSYGLSLFADRNADFVVKGTFIFFISLVILILLIFV